LFFFLNIEKNDEFLLLKMASNNKRYFLPKFKSLIHIFRESPENSLFPDLSPSDFSKQPSKATIKIAKKLNE